MSVGQAEAKVRLLHNTVCSLFLFSSRLFGLFFPRLVYFAIFPLSFLPLQLKPVDTSELSSLPPCIHLLSFPCPLPLYSQGPKAGVGACGSLPALLVRTWTLSLSLSLGGTMLYIALDHIFSAPHLFHFSALCFCFLSVFVIFVLPFALSTYSLLQPITYFEKYLLISHHHVIVLIFIVLLQSLPYYRFETHLIGAVR